MDNREFIKHLIEKLRAVTLATQIMPFIYAGLYVVVLLLYMFASDATLDVIDTLFYVSPVVVIGNLILSRILELCRWHKACCLLPLLPQINIIIDRYIYEFSSNAIKAHLIMLITMTILLIISAYNVFFKH